jgi:hypothetical protein
MTVPFDMFIAFAVSAIVLPALALFTLFFW